MKNKEKITWIAIGAFLGGFFQAIIDYFFGW